MLKVLLFIFLLSSCASDFSKRQKHLAYPTVVKVFPSTKVIPSNITRFYIKFSHPMKEGNFLNKISLLDERGNELKGIFFDNIYELWSEGRTMLTLLVDPGRVKSGLKENLKFGRAFKVGKKYYLVIKQNYESINGKALSNKFVHEYIASAEDLISPQPEKWSIENLKINTTSPLRVNLSETLNYQNIKDYIKVVDEFNNLVRGYIKIEEKETKWSFYPLHPWSSTVKYYFIVNEDLEDLAGNSIYKLYESKKNSSYRGGVFRKELL